MAGDGRTVVADTGHDVRRAAAAPLSPLIDAEAEFNRFAAELIPAVRRGRKVAHRDEEKPRKPSGHPPSVTTEHIYEHALHVLDQNGLSALTVRRLAADLGISTRTLYKRIGSHNSMIRTVTMQHFASLDLSVQEACSWESAAWNWCRNLHDTLCRHPHLTALMTADEVGSIYPHSTDLACFAVQSGISPNVAANCCRSLVDVTINDAMRQVRTEPQHGCSPASATSSSGSSWSLFESVRWILAGVRAHSLAEATKCSARLTSSPSDFR